MIHLLFSDMGLWLMTLFLIAYARHSYHHLPTQYKWQAILASPIGRWSMMISLLFWLLALMDSVHFNHPGTPSLLDYLLTHLHHAHEQTYSPPFAHFNTITSLSQEAKPLQHINPQPFSILTTHMASLALALLTLYQSLLFLLKKTLRLLPKTVKTLRRILRPLVLGVVFLALAILLSHHYHILGTNKIGQDVFYQCLKSIRTGMVIALVTTLFSLPIAVILGAVAGYLGGWVDDAIQYLYTTLSAIPGVLLISAAVLTLQMSMTHHPEWFNTLAERADARLLALCLILALTGWTPLCRLIRAEVLKLKTLAYVECASTMGISNWRIITRHLIPNAAHLILITAALDFSALVLAEAVLSYIGVGVDPTTLSWGNMINASRLELARTPMIWWPLAGSFGFMLTLVLSINLLAEQLQKHFKPPASA